MTMDHPRWAEFLDRLDGPEGVDAQESDAGFRFCCHHDHRFARRILARMGLDRAEVAASVEWFELHGGFCDCEVLLNVEADEEHRRSSPEEWARVREEPGVAMGDEGGRDPEEEA
jgi:hypothetical protein